MPRTGYTPRNPLWSWLEPGWQAYRLAPSMFQLQSEIPLNLQVRLSWAPCGLAMSEPWTAWPWSWALGEAKGVVPPAEVRAGPGLAGPLRSPWDPSCAGCGAQYQQYWKAHKHQTQPQPADTMSVAGMPATAGAGHPARLKTLRPSAARAQGTEQAFSD